MAYERRNPVTQVRKALSLEKKAPAERNLQLTFVSCLFRKGLKILAGLPI